MARFKITMKSLEGGQIELFFDKESVAPENQEAYDAKVKKAKQDIGDFLKFHPDSSAREQEDSYRLHDESGKIIAAVQKHLPGSFFELAFIFNQHATFKILAKRGLEQRRAKLSTMTTKEGFQFARDRIKIYGPFPLKVTVRSQSGGENITLAFKEANDYAVRAQRKYDDLVENAKIDVIFFLTKYPEISASESDTKYFFYNASNEVIDSADKSSPVAILELAVRFKEYFKRDVFKQYVVSPAFFREIPAAYESVGAEVDLAEAREIMKNTFLAASVAWMESGGDEDSSQVDLGLSRHTAS